jgi:hypothetical protein
MNWKFHIPDLKVGTLDQLVGQSDDLGKQILASSKTLNINGQFYKTFHTLEQIYKCILKWDNMIQLRKYFNNSYIL